jgi:hypothetical protein
MDDDRVPASGVRVLVKARPRAFGQVPGVVIERVRHAELGHEWVVIRMLDEWEHPDLEPGERGQPGPVEVCRYVLQVHGPLPGQRGERGYFEMTVRSYGDRPGWWVTAGE